MGLNMTEEKLNKQRDVVRNELRQTIENRPYGKAEEYMSRLLYPPGHPYHIGVAGLHEDLQAATVTNVKDFFANFYVPNNASLVVAGDFDSKTIKPLVEQLFGALPRGGDVKQRTAAPAKLESVVRYTMIDKVQLPRIMIAYHSPRAYQAGDDEKLAVEVDASQNGFPLGSVFQIDILTKPDALLERVEQIVDEEIAKLTSEGPQPAELDERKTTIELRMLSSLQSLQTKADRLNEYEYYYGEPDSFQRDLDRFRNATPEGVKNWARQILTPGARAIVRVLPQEPQRPETPRDKRPDALAQKPFVLPPAEAFTLSNGLPVSLWRRGDLPLAAMTLILRPGGALDTPEKAGLAALATNMIDEGAGDLDAPKFSQAMQSLGAGFGARADQETISVSLSVLRRNFEKAAALFADAIRRPRMESSDWQRVKALHLDELEQEDDEPTAVAAKVGARILFGDRDPFAWPSDGVVATVQKIELDEVKAAHQSLFSPAHAALFIAGDITAADAKAVLEKLLGDWKPAGSPRAASRVEHAFAVTGGPLVALVHRPDAVQTVIQFVTPGVTYRDPQRMKLRLMNTILGGSFTSRLNQNLREAHGYTYGARSNFSMEIETGWFIAASSVRTDVTGAALHEFLSEFRRLASGDISDTEAMKARETVRTNSIRAFEGLRGLTGAAAACWASSLPFDSIASDLAAIENTSAGELNELAKTAIGLDRGVLVLVGDREKILPQLKELGLPAVREFDERGAPRSAGAAE
ncbi:MAG: insulinase family protein [Planctomycetes bacterium]|nr:insulinase family protein [Planctomycetota bacterium]